MPLDLYYMKALAPSRAVMMVGEALGLEFNLHPVNVHQKEHLKPEFVAVNPLKTVPTLVDGDLTLSESPAICMYLVSKYGKDDSLYPKDLTTRARVDRALFFERGTLHRYFLDCVQPIYSGKATTISPEAKARVGDALSAVNLFLGKFPYVGGDHLTIADYCLAATVSTIEAVGGDLSKHTNVVAWLAKCKAELAGYEKINQVGVDELANFTKSFKK